MKNLLRAIVVAASLIAAQSAYAVCNLTNFYTVKDGNGILQSIQALILGGCLILPQSVPTDQTGAPYSAINPPPLPTNAAKDGTDATGVSQLTGATGIRGWLSGIYSKLTTGISTVPTDSRPAAGAISAQDVASTVTAGQDGASIITGNATNNSFATWAISGVTTANIQLSGTWTGAITLEGSIDGGVTWIARTAHVIGTVYSRSTMTANGQFQLEMAGFTNIRARATAAWTGAAAVTITLSATTGPIQILNPQRLVDGSSGAQVTVKPASTPPASTDTSVVTAINPNSLLPAFASPPSLGAGSLTIGYVGVVPAYLGTVGIQAGIWTAAVTGPGQTPGFSSPALTVATRPGLPLLVQQVAGPPQQTTPVPSVAAGILTASASTGATATAIKTSGGNLCGWYIYNSNVTVEYVQIFDLAVASVTLGTTAPKLSLGIPAGGGANVGLPYCVPFSVAMTYAVTTTRGGSSAPSSTVDVNWIIN